MSDNVVPLVTLTLEFPKTVGKKTYTELSFNRRLNGSDIRPFPDEMDIGAQMMLISKITDVGMEVLDKLDAADIMAARRVLSSFLRSGPAAGAAPSES